LAGATEGGYPSPPLVLDCRNWPGTEDATGMAADYSRIHRLLHILTLIQSSKGWTARRLAEECQTTQRTIYRDLQMLEGAGIPYFFDEQTRSYAIRSDFFLPSVQLTLDETLALAALAEHAGGREQIPFTKPASRALSKIRGVVPEQIRRELSQIVDHVSIRLAASNPPEAAQDVYDQMRHAIAQRKALRCSYDSVTHTSASGDGTTRDGDEVFVFKPYELFFSQRAWYAIGHHGGRGAIRCLKLNRFTKVEQTAQAYEIPKSFSIEKHLGNAWRMIRGAKSHQVELIFDAPFADTVADTHWHKTQEIIWQDDGSILFRCTVDGLDEIVWWVLSMGPHCTVRRPAELAQRVRDLAIATAGLYSQPKPPARRSTPTAQSR
jgi:proteasome accessory factor B